MKKKRILLRILTLWLIVSLFQLWKSGSLRALSDPSVEQSDVEHIRTLPYGVVKNPSLIVRSRHVRKVKFSGAGSSSKHGFVQEHGIVKDGLWLHFRNSGPESWSSCIIEFEANLDASKYNSLVLWVRSLERKQRLTLTLQDRGWIGKTRPQAKSGLFPSQGLPAQKIVQVVIPFKSLSTSSSLDFSRLARIEFEFGRKSAGNGEADVVEILGLAFVDQKEIPSRIILVDPERPNEKSVAARTPSHPAPAPSIPEAELAPLPTLSPLPTPLLKIVEVSEAPKKAPRKIFNPFSELPDLPYILVSFLILALGALLLIQHKGRLSRTGWGPVFHKLNWPLLDEGLANKDKAEKGFWKKLNDRKISCAWISPYQASIDRDPTDEHYGETFLRRQVKAAERSGIRLVPSLCFVRRIFHFEAFLANPQLYLTKPIPPSEIHLSDEELRVKYIGYFPVWVPPFWQKQQSLPQKLLVAYGKLPGLMATPDSVQFNLRSPELRRMAVRVIERFIQSGAEGVRIEGAAAMLNSSLNLYWGGAFNELGLAQDREFWDEVIQEVKAKHPDFLFFADGVGPAAQKLIELGFDYFENNTFMEVLYNQIRLEEIGALESLVAPEASHLLSCSIYDVAAMFRTSSPGSIQRQQSLLCGMLVGFLPGIIQHDGQIPQELATFYSLISKWPILRKGRFVRLATSSNDILAFARWENKSVSLLLANFSNQRHSVSIRFDPFLNRLESRKLYLFSDALHGASLLNDLRTEGGQPPALAVLGQDLRESGLTLSLSGLSLRLFSVNLGHPIQHDIPSEVRQFHKT